MSEEQLDTATEEVVQTQEVQPEVAAPENDAAFEEGFNAASGNEPVVKEEPAPAKVEFTLEEVEMLRARAREVERLKEQEAKIFGTIGSLKQRLDRLSQLPPQQTVQLTKESFKTLGSEFPELAESLAKDLSGLPFGGGVDRQALMQEIQSHVQAVEDRVTKQSEVKLLSVIVPDWKAQVLTPEFQQWKQSLPFEDRYVLEEGWDASEIGKRLKQFSEWKSKTAQATVSKQNRLAAAVSPRSASRVAATQTDEDAFQAGFKEARGMR